MLLSYNHRCAGALVRSVVRHAGRFVRNEAAGTAIVFALILPVLIAGGGAALDYSFALMTQTKMRGVADSAALASVREIQLARTDSSRITAIANNVVNSMIQGATSKINVDFQAMTVQVIIRKQYTPFFQFFSKTNLQASATAKMSGSMPLCLLGLDPTAPQTIGLSNRRC